MSKLAYWLCRLFGTVLCSICQHPRHAHDAGDCFRVSPTCIWCSDHSARLRDIQPGASIWRDVLVKANHAYVPEPWSPSVPPGRPSR